METNICIFHVLHVEMNLTTCSAAYYTQVM